jgi:hypothetical protein
MRRGSGHKRNKWGPGIKQQEVYVVYFIYDSDILLTHRQPLPYALSPFSLVADPTLESAFSMSADGTRSNDLSRIYACM